MNCSWQTKLLLKNIFIILTQITSGSLKKYFSTFMPSTFTGHTKEFAEASSLNLLFCVCCGDSSIQNKPCWNSTLDVEQGHEVLRITSLPSELWQCPPWGTVAEKHYFLEKMIHCECQHSGSFRNSVMDPETLSKIKLLFKGEISQTHTHVCSALHIQIALKKWWVQLYFDKTENTV